MAIATLVPVALFQYGLLKHLPDPPGNLFASDVITSSKAAHPFDIPDSALGLASYSITLGLALGAPYHRLTRKALGVKLFVDSGFVAVNTVRQLVAFKRACSWCMLTGAATAVMVAAGREYLSEHRPDCCKF